MLKKPNRPKVLLVLLFVLFLFLIALVPWLRSARQQELNRQLIAALVNGNTRQALVLVNAGADPNTRYEATPKASPYDLLKQFFQRSPPLLQDNFHTEDNHHNPTALAIACGSPWIFDRLLMSFRPKVPDDDELVKAMLSHGAVVDAQDVFGSTPLLFAARWNHLRTVQLLLEHGANVNMGGGVILMRATSSTPDLVKLLLDHGAWVNRQDVGGTTALSRAVARGADKEVIRQLLQHGADPNIGDKLGRTPLKLAQQAKRPYIITLLRQAGAKK